MRSSIEFSVTGDTVDDILDSAAAKWRSFMDDADIELPNDAELHVVEETTGSSSKLTATIIIRTKIETGAR